jgi:hypothetical protein
MQARGRSVVFVALPDVGVGVVAAGQCTSRSHQSAYQSWSSAS